jgi:uncharacterized membrane protein YdbT with pleckstrin-like domain
MGYIEKNLLPGENIIYQTKIHWIIFFWSVIFLLIGIICFTGNEGNFYSGIVFVLIAIYFGIRALVFYKTSEFGVTNKRVLVKFGFIRRTSFEVLLSKIEGIHVKQGIFGRIFNYGSVVIAGTGGSKQPSPMIFAPFEFRKKILEQIEKNSVSQ